MSGLMGPVVVYELNGKQVMRSRPRRHKKSKASQESAKQFGQASRMSCSIRAYTPGGTIMQPATHHRLTGAIRNWLQFAQSGAGVVSGFSTLENFQFNEKASISEKWRATFSIDWTRKNKIVVNVPEFVPMHDIAAPRNIDTIRCTVLATSTTLTNSHTVTSMPYNQFDIKYNDKMVKAQSVEVPLAIKSGALNIVIFAMKYLEKQGGELSEMTDEKWLPTGIIGMFYRE